MERLPKIYKDKQGLKLEAKFLSEETYVEAMEGLVIVCADALVINRKSKTVYLAKRKAKPCPDWFMLGGRLKRGQTELQAIATNVERETGLKLSESRFQFIGLYRFWWASRQQKPQNKGADTLAFVFALELSAAEMERASKGLDPKEYKQELGLKEFSRNDIIKHNLHPVILDLYKQIFT